MVITSFCHLPERCPATSAFLSQFVYSSQTLLCHSIERADSSATLSVDHLAFLSGQSYSACTRVQRTQPACTARFNSAQYDGSAAYRFGMV